MRPSYRIIEARERDLPFLPVIELAAARLLVGQAPESVLTETTGLEHFRDAQAGGRLLGRLGGRNSRRLRSGGFLMKDILLLGAALFTAGEALGAARRR